jgi:hypothetical protein
VLAGGALSACGDDSGDDEPAQQAQPTTTPPPVPNAAGPGVEQLTTIGGERRDSLIACLDKAGVESEALDYLGVASGDEEFHFEGPATEVHFGEGDRGHQEGAEADAHAAAATVVTFDSEEIARRVFDAWTATSPAVLAADSVILGDAETQLEGAPETEAVSDCLAGP